MENKFLAKSKPVETIAEHTRLLVEHLESLKRLYPRLAVDWELLRLAVLFHDIGKINTKFQNKLYKKLNFPLLEDGFKDAEEIPHGNLSAALMDRVKLKEAYDDENLRILYQSVYFHHARFIDRGGLGYYKEYIKADLPKYITPGAGIFNIPYFRELPIADFNRYIAERIDNKEGKEDLFYRYVLIKGLLNRLDYAASAHLGNVEEPNRDLETKTLAYLKQKGGLRDIQEYLLAHPDENNVVVASTGIGKTEAGLLWIGNAKGFFTLPLRVSINAIYKRVKEKDIRFDGTALLHSDALAFLIKNDEDVDYFKEYTKARQLTSPLTVTTVDQLFKFVFKEEGFESILATLSYSKLIIDEIQMYSPEIVACILVGLKHITRMGGKFSILTATFPGVLKSFMEKLGLRYNYREFILDRERHMIALIDGDISDAVADIIAKGRESKVLVIVNTVRKAQEIFEALGDIEGKFLLHSRFIKRDRSRLETDIMAFSEGSGAGVWVTTQIVEASLDIDFDYLFTELSTVDGLFQRMGRCYRKRELLEEKVNVHVFTRNPSGLGSIIDRDIYRLSVEALRPFHGSRISEKEKLAVVGNVYSLEKIGGTRYYRDIRERVEFLENIPAYEFDRKEVDEKFRNIRSHTVIPFAVYERNRALIHDTIAVIGELGFSDAERVERIKRVEELKELTVDVPCYICADRNVLRQVEVDRYNTVKIVNLEYSSRLGLTAKTVNSNIL